MRAWSCSSSKVYRTTSVASASVMPAAMSTTPSAGPRAWPCPSSATCARACSRRHAATCSTRCWPREWPKAAGREPRLAICSHSPTVVVSFLPVSRSVLIRAWPFSTCTRQVRSGAKAPRQQRRRLSPWSRRLPRSNRHFASGWHMRAWVTNDAFCGSLLAA
ncbi:hypothetical protein D3C81_966240 [compost metagenome]